MKRILSNALSALAKIVTPVRLIAIASVGGIFVFLVLGDKGIYQFRRLMDMRNGLLAERTKLNESIDRLTREKVMLEDPKNLEPIIRSELGYIKPGEVLFEEKPAREK